MKQTISKHQVPCHYRNQPLIYAATTSVHVKDSEECGKDRGLLISSHQPKVRIDSVGKTFQYYHQRPQTPTTTLSTSFIHHHHHHHYPSISCTFPPNPSNHTPMVNFYPLVGKNLLPISDFNPDCVSMNGKKEVTTLLSEQLVFYACGGWIMVGFG